MPNSSMKIKYNEGSKVDKVNLAELERQAQLDENSFEDNPSINADINNKNIKTLLQDAENRIEKEQERKDANTDRQMREAAEKHFRRDLNEGGSMLMPPKRKGYSKGGTKPKSDAELFNKIFNLTKEQRDEIEDRGRKAMENSPLYKQLKAEHEKEQERKEDEADAFLRNNERIEVSKGGMMNYAEGGSMLMPPEREGYVLGAAVKLGSKALKTAKKHVDDLKTKPTEGQDKIRDVTLAQRAARETQRKTGLGTATLIGGGVAADKLLSNDSDTSIETEEPEVPVYSIEDLPTEGAIIIESDKGEVTYKNTKLNKELKKAIKNKEEEVTYEDETFNTEALKTALNDFSKSNKESKSMGGKMKYAEGSMLMPPEMEIEEQEQEMPVDTYPNIPPDEMAAAEASQLPDEQMEDKHLEYVLDEALDPEDQEYLMGVLETDERLSNIFDKVMDVAAEFSGEGEVDGPGTGVSDSIPARLSDGEFVFTKKATDQIGSDQLQTMMDDAERAYDGGYMKKAFGGLTLDPMDNEKSYGVEQMNETQNELRKQMLGANRMPSVLR